jgi:hypothetical protein
VSTETTFLGYDGQSKNYRVLIDGRVDVYAREFVRFEEISADVSGSVPHVTEAAEDDLDEVPDLVASDADFDDVAGGTCPTDHPTNVAAEVPVVSLAPLGDVEVGRTCAQVREGEQVSAVWQGSQGRYGLSRSLYQ